MQPAVRKDEEWQAAYTLLHLHSNLPECLSELPAPPEPTLDSLAQTWFGTA